MKTTIGHGRASHVLPTKNRRYIIDLDQYNEIKNVQ